MDNFFVSSYSPGDALIGVVEENIGTVGILTKRFQIDPLSYEVNKTWAWKISWLSTDKDPENIFDKVMLEEELREQINTLCWSYIKVRK
jgi:hypothetical protein